MLSLVSHPLMPSTCNKSQVTNILNIVVVMVVVTRRSNDGCVMRLVDCCMFIDDLAIALVTDVGGFN